tara:strand:- start:241 stop:741 length:501 start_codon:yes stop_codon:yes gene_type:complete
MASKNRSEALQVVKGVWDITGVGTLATNASYGCETTTAGGGQAGKIIIPEGALITRAWTYCETAITDDGDNSTTAALGYTGATGAFIVAVAINTVQYAAGIGMTLVDNYALDGGALTALNMGIARDATMIALTTDVELLLTLNNDHNVDAGKFTLFVEYVQTGDLA